MAFDPANLTIVIPDNGPRAAVASYVTPDTFEDTLAVGYFDASLLRAGDAQIRGRRAQGQRQEETGVRPR